MIQLPDDRKKTSNHREPFHKADGATDRILSRHLNLEAQLAHYDALVAGTEPISVLIVDDDELILKLLSLSLDSVGHTVVGKVTRATKALQKAAELKPDLVILDVGMPDGDGIDIAEKIVSSLGIPTLICTGSSRPETIKRVSCSNIRAYLVKPFSQAQLSATVCIAVGQHRRHLASRLRLARSDEFN